MRPRAATGLLASLVFTVAALVGPGEGTARADKIEDLCRALTQDPSYKVRVQAALVLGKLNDRRALDSLKIALRDENESVRGVAATSLGRMGDKSVRSALEEATRDPSEFVRAQAKKALAQLDSSGPAVVQPSGGVRFGLVVGFQGKSRDLETVRSAVSRELSKLPQVAVGPGGKETLLIDGSIQRLSASGGQVDCDLKAFVATYPGKSIKMMTSAGASLSASPAEVESAKRDCLAAAAEAIREDVGKYLKTLQ